MAQQRLVKVEDIGSVTHDFLWRAANEILEKTPTISQHLAGTLVLSVPEDGMSSFAKRMHCTGCGGLMVAAKVRLRKTAKRCRDRNRVLRTCPACDKTNKDAGVPRGLQVTARDKSNIEELRKQTAKAKRRKSRGKNTPENDLPIAKNSARSKKKRKRSKSLDSASNRSADSNRNKFAASFLFEPL